MKESAQYDFYDRQTKSLNPIRRWWHQKRRDIIYDMVNSEYIGGEIVDLGCGNCCWNYRKQFNVTGIDINLSALEYAEKIGRINKYHCGDIVHTELPDSSVSLVVTSEVLEHISAPESYLTEIWRILETDGRLVITVPYDTTFSLWRPLFSLQCVLKGDIGKDEYYKGRCGHIHAFNELKLFNLLRSNGFRPIRLYVMWKMTLCCIAMKEIE